MRTALPLGLGVAGALVVAVFIGAAAATTGAPVFYDARQPAMPSIPADEYDIDPGGAREPVEDATTDVDQAPTDTALDAPPPPGSIVPAPAVPPPGLPSDAPAPSPHADGGASDGIGADDGSNVGPPTPEEQGRWLAFQEVVRECMAEAGQEYLYWEWWDPALDASNRFPAMPADLSPDEVAAWQRALTGNAGRVQDSRSPDAGCRGRAVHLTGDDG